MRFLNIFAFITAFSGVSYAQIAGIISGADHQALSLEQSLAAITPGTILVVGENHGLWTHQNQQMQILEALIAKGLKVSVGMEFFSYTHQDLVNSYLSGELAEADFLRNIEWGSPAYDYYRDQVRAPLRAGGWTWALNAPRFLTGKIAREGLASLTLEERALLPLDFTLGRASYKDRFLALMPHLPSQEAGERYFAAQSAWDDTMAWRVADFMAANSDHVLVIIVGDFHVAWGGGLPNRIKARLNSPQSPVVTFSLINTQNATAEEIANEIAPEEGGEIRADYIWLSEAL